MISVVVALPTDDIVSVDVDEDETVENLKALVEVQTQIPLAHQRLFYSGRELANTAVLRSIGIVSQDVLQLLVAAAAAAPGTSVSSATSASAQGVPSAQQLAELAMSNPAELERLMATNPAVSQFVQNLMANRGAPDPFEAELARLDPMSEAYQRKLEQSISQKNIEENLAYAMEHNPESFASVFMLYVDCHVNGVNLKAFVDSGAQTTIMSLQCAERCNISRLIDRRFRGIAMGVGQTAIIGRIHAVPAKFGNTFYSLSVTVLDSDNMEFLLGLDMLRKLQATMHLGPDNCLQLGPDNRLPFLSEGEVPKTLRTGTAAGDAASVSPTVSGPSSRQGPANGPGSHPTPFSGQGRTLGSGSTPAHAPSSSPAAATVAATPTPVSGSSQCRPSPAVAAAFPEEAVRTLMDMGFQREAVIKALSRARGNVDVAANILVFGE
eukprot:ANDGO_01212.mRNA.1 DNA damage-inducible protein 1